MSGHVRIDTNGGAPDDGIGDLPMPPPPAPDNEVTIEAGSRAGGARIQNEGAILAVDSLAGVAVSGSGPLAVGAGGTLEVGGSVASGQTVNFSGSLPATLILDDPLQFLGAIAGVVAGDQIVLPGAGLTNGSSVVAATIGDLNGVQTLQVFEGTNNVPAAVLMSVPIVNATGGDLIGESLAVAPNPGGTGDILTVPDTRQPGLVIDESYDSSISSLADTATMAAYEYAIQQATDYYENEFVNQVTANITFKWSAKGGISNQPQWFKTTYAALYEKVAGFDPSLPAVDPTGGAAFGVTTAEAKTLGLIGPGASSDGSVQLDSSQVYDWVNQGTIGSNAVDATGALEHEISEELGRIDTAGTFQYKSPGQYTLLDMFRYTAIDGGAFDPAGTPVGSRDEPFAATGDEWDTGPASAGPSVYSYSYFSPDGVNITLPYNIEPAVVGGADVGDWSGAMLSDGSVVFSGGSLAVPGDVFNSAAKGELRTISATDVQEMVVLGYDTVSCFAAGTRISSERGEIPVEQLRAGDRMHVLLAGEPQPIIWIGHRSIDCARHPNPRAVWPVRVAAGAFGDGLPRNDLFLSPDHAIHIDGGLIPVRHLIDGAAISQVPMERVTYYHIELPRHDVLFAEGLPAESFLDSGDRGDNVRLFPGFSVRVWEAYGCAQLIVAGPELDAARRLIDRCAATGRTRRAR